MLSFQSWEHTISAVVSENNNPLQKYIVHISWQHSSLFRFPVAKNTDFSQPYFQYAFNIYIKAAFDKQGFWISLSEHCVQLHYLQYHGTRKIYPPTVTTNIDTKKGVLLSSQSLSCKLHSWEKPISPTCHYSPLRN